MQLQLEILPHYDPEIDSLSSLTIISCALHIHNHYNITLSSWNYVIWNSSASSSSEYLVLDEKMHGIKGVRLGYSYIDIILPWLNSIYSYYILTWQDYVQQGCKGNHTRRHYESMKAWWSLDMNMNRYNNVTEDGISKSQGALHFTQVIEKWRWSTFKIIYEDMNESHEGEAIRKHFQGRHTKK